MITIKIMNKLLGFNVIKLLLLFGVFKFGNSTDIEITPTTSIVRVDEPLYILCKVPYRLDSCRYLIGTNSYRLTPNGTGPIRYYGESLAAGQCGVFIERVKLEYNGLISCVVPPETGNIELKGEMELIVAVAPKEGSLIIKENSFIEGENIRAQCIAPDARPAARISFTIGDTELAETSEDVITTDPSTGLSTLVKDVTHIVTPDDDGQLLNCLTFHKAIEGSTKISRQIFVSYAPHREGAAKITLFGFHLGADESITVEIRANPAPSIEWRVNDEIINSATPASEKYIYENPIATGRGYYNCSLIVKQMDKDDVERDYFLKASNTYGSTEYHVRLTTLDEPPTHLRTLVAYAHHLGLRFSTGAILGIVIGLIAVLIVIVMVVFAAITSRWCFKKDQGRDITKGSGESTPAAGDVLLESGVPSLQTGPSDTESAVGGRSTRWKFSELRDRVRSVLPKHKDKVQAADQLDNAEEDKPATDEKKGVVYAELALGEQQVDKPPPSSTEYAEIVYSYQPESEENKPQEPAKP